MNDEVGKTITETMKLEVSRPVNGDWPAFERKVNALSLPLHRVLNGVITDLEIADRAGLIKSKKDGPGTSSMTLADRYAKQLWETERVAAAARIEAGKPYRHDDAVADIDPLSHSTKGAASAAHTRWAKWRKDRWKGASSIPSFRAGAPLFVKAAACQIATQDGRHVLSVRLVKGGPERLIVQPCGGKDHALVRLLILGEGKLGDIKIKRVKMSKGPAKTKWIVNVAVTHARRPVAEGGRTMALHRGVSTFLAYAISNERGIGEVGIIEDGGAIRAHKSTVQARRRSLSHHGKSLGTGAKGRGRKRRYKRITDIDDAEARWVRSKCQETAAHALRLAERRGVTRIVVEDWTNPAKDGAPELGEWMERVVRTFPLAQLRESILWAAKKRGIEVVTRAGAYQSRTCPNCGHVCDSAPGGAKFSCPECLFERSREVIAAIHLLRADGQGFKTSDLVAATKRAAGVLA